jgi:hypothetical protein
MRRREKEGDIPVRSSSVLGVLIRGSDFGRHVLVCELVGLENLPRAVPFGCLCDFGFVGGECSGKFCVHGSRDRRYR